jgi:hypothetical protein
MLRVFVIVADANRLSVVNTSDTITRIGREKSFRIGPVVGSWSRGSPCGVLSGEGRNEDIETVEDIEVEGEIRVEVEGGVKVPGGYGAKGWVEGWVNGFVLCVMVGV